MLSKHKIVIPPELVVPFVKEGIFSDSRITLFYGWRDGGKSTSIATILILKCLFDPHFRCAHIRKHYNELDLSTYTNLKDQIKRMGLTQYFKFTKQHFMIANALRPSNYFFGAGADNPDKIRSTQDLSYVWFEEFHDCEQGDFESIYGSIRTKIGFTPKFIASFNNDKVAPDSFIAKTFFDVNGAMYNKVERILINHRNNQFIDQKETDEKHIGICLGDEEKRARLVAGEFIEEENRTAWLYVDFSSSFTGLRIDVIPGNTIYLSFDFNNEPMTCTAWQLSSGFHPMNGDGHFVHAVAEFEASMAETDEEIISLLCAKINAAFPFHPKRITGDANGRNRLKGVPGNKSIYMLVAKYLNVSPQLIDVPNTNMELTPSRALCNTFMYNHRSVLISTVSTPKLVKDMRGAKADPEKPDQIVKDRALNKNDYFDTFRYIVHTYFNYFLR